MLDTLIYIELTQNHTYTVLCKQSVYIYLHSPLKLYIYIQLYANLMDVYLHRIINIQLFSNILDTLICIQLT